MKKPILAIIAVIIAAAVLAGIAYMLIVIFQFLSFLLSLLLVGIDFVGAPFINNSLGQIIYGPIGWFIVFGLIGSLVSFCLVLALPSTLVSIRKHRQLVVVEVIRTALGFVLVGFFFHFLVTKFYDYLMCQMGVCS